MKTIGKFTCVLLLAGGLAACDSDDGSAVHAPRTTTAATTAAPTSPTATASRTPTVSVDPDLPLTDSELVWLAHFERDAKKIQDRLIGGPATIGSSSAMGQEADSARTCSKLLAGASEPGQRLLPVNRLFAEACLHYNRAARCADGAAAIMKKEIYAGSGEDRKLDKAIDCYTAELKQGTDLLGEALEKAVDIRIDADSL